MDTGKRDPDRRDFAINDQLFWSARECRLCLCQGVQNPNALRETNRMLALHLTKGLFQRVKHSELALTVHCIVTTGGPEGETPRLGVLDLSMTS